LEELDAPKAIHFRDAVEAHAFATLLECRRDGIRNIVVFEADVEVPQRSAYDIREIERLAVVFSSEDTDYPQVLSLRSDFPSIPHLYVNTINGLSSLCLYEQPYSEIKLKWTGFRFVERIREFLSSTAKGELHQPDQPLEPLLSPSAQALIISSEFLGAASGTVEFFNVALIRAHSNETLIASKKAALPRNAIAIVLEGQIRNHGVITRAPMNLKELQEFASSTAIDVVGTLRRALRHFAVEKPFPASEKAFILLVLRLPKSREPGGPKETEDYVGYLSFDQIGLVGEKLGLWTFHDGNIGILLQEQEIADAAEIKLSILRPQAAMSGEIGAMFSGTSAKPIPGAFIGVGSLGSNILPHFARTGFGKWTIIDNDVLLAHNLARHGAHWGAGLYKVDVIAQQLNAMFEEQDVFIPLQADVLRYPEQNDLQQALNPSCILVDCAASVPVSRFLAIDVKSKARRFAAYLNPNGTDVVVLAEDQNREIRLDYLEMQYYAMVIHEAALHGHLRAVSTMRRYSNGCRDRSLVIPEERIAVLSAIASQAIRGLWGSPEAAIRIWTIEDSDLNVRSYSTLPSRFEAFEANGWTIHVDTKLIENLHSTRLAKLPCETGGVLIGSFDTQRQIVYVVDQIASPDDSDERPTSYIRGCHGLEQKCQEIARITQGGLEYVGEWHSHPDYHDAERSVTDMLAANVLAKFMCPEGLPVLTIIVGYQNATRVYLESYELLAPSESALTKRI
jgi:integrative and conjugative element protein (TIGR02256 family)